MKRFLAVFVCLLALVSGSISTAFAIVNLGDPRVTRLWRLTDEGEKFACSATWVRPAKGQVSWLLTAGHCAKAEFVKRTANETILAHIDWRAVITTHNYADNLIDIAIGTAPDSRPERVYHSFFANKNPVAGTLVYIHGFPEGVETVTVATVLGYDGPGIGVMRAHTDTIRGGSSGSVMLDSNGLVVGVLWGKVVEDPTLIYFTPVERLNDIIAMIGAHFYMSPDAE